MFKKVIKICVGCVFLSQAGINLVLPKEVKGSEMSESTAEENKLIRPLLGAIMHDRLDGPKGVKKLSEDKSLLEERSVDGTNMTPLICAASTGSWQMAEVLLKAGADPWAYDEFGGTIGEIAFPDGYYNPGRTQRPYWQKVQKILLKIGYTNPPISGDNVLHFAKEGKWPPAGVKLTAEGIKE